MQGGTRGPFSPEEENAFPLNFRRKHRGNDVAEGFCRLSLLGLG